MNTHATDSKIVESLFGSNIVRDGNKLLEMGWKLLHIGQESESNAEGAAQGTAAYYGWTGDGIPLKLEDYENFMGAQKEIVKMKMRTGSY